MDSKSGKTKGKRRKRITFFYWEKRLHKVLRINKPANLVDAWSFSEHKSVSILYSDFRQHAGKAITTVAAARLMNVHKMTLFRAWHNGNIHEPEKSYPLIEGSTKPGVHYWGEHNMLELHDYMMTVHRGRPRNDGMVIPYQNLPTRAELIGLMNNTQPVYIKDEDGKFIPLFKPPTF